MQMWMMKLWVPDFRRKTDGSTENNSTSVGPKFSAAKAREDKEDKLVGEIYVLKN